MIFGAVETQSSRNGINAREVIGLRKIGIWISAVGAAVTVGLLLVQQTNWFAVQRSGEMSDFAQLVFSAFWAAILTALLGVCLLLLSLRRNARKPELEKPVPMEITWVCAYCGGQNTAADSVCSVCGTPKYVPPQVWTCGWCGTDNPEGEQTCSRCHAPRGVKIPVWTCPRCGSQNPETTDFCVLCRAGRYRTTAFWKCRLCGSQNPEGIGTCLVCKAPRQRPVNTWQCAACGTRNPTSIQHCFVCRTPRPLTGAWSCPRCGARNGADDLHCGECGARRPERSPMADPARPDAEDRI